MLIITMEDGSIVHDYIFEISRNHYQMVDVWDNSNFIFEFFNKLDSKDDMSDILSEIHYFNVNFINENRNVLLDLFNNFTFYREKYYVNVKSNCIRYGIGGLYW